MVSQRKKKLNKSDFNKPKLKVGKTLPKNLNVTKIDLQTKKLIIKSQLKSGINEHSSVDKKKRTIPELLVKVCHMNENMRADAVTSLDEILFPLEAVNKSDLMANLSAIVRKLCVVLCDASLQVRKLACSLFGKICDSVSERDFEGLFDVFLAHLCNALTHVDEAIQKSALLLLYRVFENYGQLAVKQGRRVLPVLVHILAPLPVSTIAKRFHSFTGSKSLKPGEYASSCNIDDMAKQTEVMKRVHQYLSRMCVEQNETQNGFAEKTIEPKLNQECGFHVQYFNTPSINLHSLFTSQHESPDDEGMDEISTSMITLTNVLFQIWISVSQNLSENVSNPTSYDQCLQSLYYALEVLKDIIILHEKPFLGIKYNLDWTLLASNFSRYVLQSFPYRVSLRGQPMLYGKQLNHCVMEVSLLPIFSSRSDILKLSESLLEYLGSYVQNATLSSNNKNLVQLLNLADGFIIHCGKGKTSRFLLKFVSILENCSSLKTEQIIRLARFVFDHLQDANEKLKTSFYTVLNDFCRNETANYKTLIKVFAEMVERNPNTAAAKTVSGFLFIMLSRIEEIHADLDTFCQFSRCISFYGIACDDHRSEFNLQLVDWFLKITHDKRCEIIMNLKNTTSCERSAQLWYLKFLLTSMLKLHGYENECTDESDIENDSTSSRQLIVYIKTLTKSLCEQLEMTKIEFETFSSGLKEIYYDLNNDFDDSKFQRFISMSGLE